jgi:ribosomal protein L34
LRTGDRPETRRSRHPFGQADRPATTNGPAILTDRRAVHLLHGKSARLNGVT